MYLAKLLLPFACVLLLYSQAMRGLAWVSGAVLIPYNVELEGAHILAERQKLEQGKFPLEFDLFLAGSSRTMSNYSPTILADRFHIAHPNIAPLKAYNLGNVADAFTLLESNLRGDAKPDILILEFSPHLFLLQNKVPLENDTYKEYRSAITHFELNLSGYTRNFLGLENTFVFNHKVVKTLAGMVRDRNLDLKGLFYYIRSLAGFGQKIRPGGQVFYRVYLPDRKAGESLSRFQEDPRDDYRKNYANLPVNPEAWVAFERLVAQFEQDGQLIVVRPPIHPELYQIENELKTDLIQKVQHYLEAHDVAFLDLNPHNYFSTDKSHIDWYDTPRLSLDLAEELLPLIRWPKRDNAPL
ncbi:MAG: hypothetical protein O2954_10370 [bacterium]|nr:hypothetical protein [bacterium]